MSGVARFARLNSRAPKQLIDLGSRSFSTCQLLAQRKLGADRTQSTAFTKKDVATKKLRSGTATSVNAANLNPLYYADKPNPQVDILDTTTAKEWNVEKFLQIDERVLQSIGKDHYPGYLAGDFKLFGKAALLYRQITQRLVDQLSKYAGEGAPKKATVIDGPNGSGKSAELLKLVSFAAASNYIVIYAYSTIRWVNSSRPYAPSTADDSFLQHEAVLDLLRTTLSLSQDALAQVSLGKSTTVGKKTFDAEKTLADLVEFGVQTPALAHDVLDQLLSVASAQTKVPVVIALDEVNALWCNTAYRDQEDAILPANRLRLVRSLLPFFEGAKTLAKGWAVGATSYLETKYMPKDLKARLNPPRAIPIANKDVASDPNLAKPATEVPFDVVKLDRLSASEAKGILDFYYSVNVVQAPVTEALVAKKWIFANGNPRQIFASITSHF
ncbi:hypothetical protein GGI12_001617 [Dipsacomyces acuminosporus]|nr:hypothetical protein GGI12_001617 [Dipsacomyces acuminosporus]